MRRRRLNFILIAQSILLLAHAFVYETWTSFWRAPDPPGVSILAVAFAVLSVSFVTASFLAFRYDNIFVRAAYTAAATWLGLVNFCFLASLLCWLAYAGVRLARAPVAPRQLATIFFGIAIAAGLYGTANSYWLRVKQVHVKLPNLPDAWRGRVAALVSDTHLGPIRTDRFSRHIVTVLNRHRPDVVFLAGDLYDGTAANVKLFAKPLADLIAPLGAYFVTGNHEEFSDPSQYIDALASASVRALQNEKVTIDGLQIVGVHYHELSTPERFGAALRQADLDRSLPSILLAHAPNRLWESERAGVTFQLCGHTHAGQFFPWTLAVLRIYGKFAYGLQQLGDMTVYTSSGAGTWGPPARLGTNPEVVLFHFD